MLFPQFLDSLSNSAERFSAGVGEGVVLTILPTIPGTTNDVLVLNRAGTQEWDTVLRPGQGALDILRELVFVADVSVEDERRCVQ